jgi:CDP-glucose 4,6-dehydratase
MFNDIYKGKKVLITGHTGFKGSWLSLWLTKLGADVIGYSKDIPTKPNHFELLDIDMISITGDVLDKIKIYNTIKRYKPDIIFHMAAQALVRKSYLEPVNTMETNIIGTINVLESVRRLGQTKAIVNITSDKSYQNKEHIWGYKEHDPMGGDDPYSASKGAADLISQAYRKSFFKPEEYKKSHTTLLANVRAGNVIGGGDWAQDRLIPDLMKAAHKGEIVIIRNPHATRPWQHVLEPLSGYLLVGAKLLKGEKEFSDDWNFGPTDEATIPVHEVIAHTAKHWDKIRHKIQADKAKLHEANLLKLDSTKARIKLQWKPVWDSHTTFEKTAKWYKEFYTNKHILTEQDLDDYINDARQSSILWTNNITNK